MKELKLEDNKKPEIKKDARYWFSLFILIIIIITFIIGQGLSVRYSKQSISFGSYDGKSIDYSQDNLMDITKNEVYNRLIYSYARMFGFEQAKSFLEQSSYTVWKSAFDSVVEKIASFKVLQKEGAHISPKKISTELAKSQYFQKDGKFNLEKYNKTPKITITKLTDAYEKNIAYSTLLSDLESYNDFDLEKESLKEMAKQKRSMDFVAFKFSDYPKEEALKYAKKNKQLFEKAEILTITLEDENSAKEILKKLENKSEFSDLAKNFSKDNFAKKGGLREQMYFYELKSQFSDDDIKKIFALKPGSQSKIIKDKNNKFVIAKLNKKEEYNQNDYKDVVSYINDNEKSIIEKYFTQKAKDLKKQIPANTKLSDYFESSNNEEETIKEDKGSEESLDSDQETQDKSLQTKEEPKAKENLENQDDKTKLEVFSTESFPINYGGINLFDAIKVKDNKFQLNDLATNDSFFENIFKMKEFEISDPISLSNSVIVYQLKESSIESDDKKLDFEQKYKGFIFNTITNSVKEVFVNSKKLINNFDNVYNKYFGNQSK